MSLNELLAAIGKVVQPSEVKVRHEPFRAGEVFATYCEMSKARNDLGFDPKTNLHDSLAKTWALVRGQEPHNNGGIPTVMTSLSIFRSHFEKAKISERHPGPLSATGGRKTS